jgi:hypothetical protein
VVKSIFSLKRYFWLFTLLLLLMIIAAIGVTWGIFANTKSEEPTQETIQNEKGPQRSILGLLNESILIDAYTRAATMEGRDSLKGVSMAQSKGQILWNGKRQEYTLIKRIPNLMRLELRSSDSSTTYGYDGKSYWQKDEVDGAQTESVPASEMDSNALHSMSNFYDPLLAYAMNGVGIIQLIEIDEWRGASVIRVQLRGSNLGRIDIYLEPDALEILGTVEHPRNSGDEYTTLFSDYRSVDGLRVPFKIRYSLGSKLIYELSLDTWMANPPEVMPSLFSAPEPL